MIRKFVIMLVLADNWLSNSLKPVLKTKWKLNGKCNKCGKCCKDIHMKIEPHLLDNRFTRTIVIMWVSWLFSFYLKRTDFKRNYLVFACKAQKADGTCGDYKWRPSVCRNYPLVDYFEEPALFPECGYKATMNFR